MTSYADRLAAMDDTFESAEAKSAGALVPDGDYEAIIQHFGFWDPSTKGKDGGLKLVTEFSVAGGDFAGMAAPSTWHELEDPDRIGWTKGYLATLGLEGVKLSELEQRLEPLVGKTRVGIRVVTKNGYRNTYVNEVLGEGDTFEPDASAEDEDDIPF